MVAISFLVLLGLLSAWRERSIQVPDRNYVVKRNLNATRADSSIGS